jgi:hypothetical protein
MNRESAKSRAPRSAMYSGSLLWMRLGLCCGLALLLAGSMFMSSRLGHALQFRATVNEATVRTAAGDWHVERPNEVGPGLPVYPDASLVLPGLDDPPATTKNSQAEVQTAIYYSSDSTEVVDNWYLEHLGPEFVRGNSSGWAIPDDVLSGASISNNDVAFVGERGDQIRIVAIATKSTGTRITLARSTTRTSQ